MALIYISYAVSLVATLLILFFLFYRIWFLRNPKRSIPKGDSLVSPANGRIIKIIDVQQKNLMIKKGMIGKIKTLTSDVGKSCWLIVIVMTPFNVHFQRAPFDGKVLKVKYTEGKLFNAVLGAQNLEATFMNEKNEILISTKFGNIKVIQIAGFVANRIKCFVKNNQNIKKGQDIGLIKLGSQVCLIIPRSSKLRLNVVEGQEVIDGETIIAKKE
ncbi:MAG: phosphatidylserine decarboxylase family protein [Nanoarchaeota archaeon]|nr:phosphatidylserine decarboxylase family protein [Nanoarchaeota archaeon]